VADPYAGDPARHRALVVRSQKPFNAETPAAILGEQLQTPNELFYVRHHLPVPHVKPEEYRLEVKGAPVATVDLAQVTGTRQSRRAVLQALCECAAPVGAASLSRLRTSVLQPQT